MDGPWRGSKKHGGRRSGGSSPASAPSRTPSPSGPPRAPPRPARDRWAAWPPPSARPPRCSAGRRARSRTDVRIGVRHLDVEIERADVVAERDQIVARVAARVLELLRLARPPAAPREQQRPAADGARADEHDRPDRHAAAAVASAVALGADAVGEVEQEPVQVALVRRGRLLGQLPGLALGQDPPARQRAHGVPGGDHVGTRPPERVADLQQRGGGLAARLGGDRARRDHDVHRTRALAGDPVAQRIGLGVGERRIGVRVDVDVVALQPGDRTVDQRTGVRGRRREQDEQRRDEERPSHQRLSAAARTRPSGARGRGRASPAAWPGPSARSAAP